MTLVYPIFSSPCSINHMTAKKEIFTIWLKSLLFHGNGCTVFNSSGTIVYRVDNYEEKRSKKVSILDLQGRVLFSIRRKKLSLLGHWNGYKWKGTNMSNEKPWFEVSRNCNLFSRSKDYNVILGCDRAKQSCYGIVELASKSSFIIFDNKHRTIAEVKPKQSFSGALLGDDVLSLVVEPQTDQSLVMALVVVYGLIKHKI